MAWYYAPDNPPNSYPFGMSPYMQAPEQLSERKLLKEITKLTGIYEQMKSEKKKKDEKSRKPKTFTFLETWGLVSLLGIPTIFVYYIAMQVLTVMGQNLINTLNVPH